MEDAGGILLRLALYVALTLGFGLPLHLLHDRAAPSSRLLLSGIVATALTLSVVGLAWLSAAMTGGTILSLDRATLAMIVTDTPAGQASFLRLAVLAIALLLASRGGAMIAVTALNGVALATLAWGGHGAIDEGARGVAHLAADIVHLLAAGAWLGAIAALLGRLGQRDADASRRALARFAATGSMLVAALLLSGIVNGWMIAGPIGPATLTSRWGMLMIVKIALFALMLGAAAANRWWLTPRIGSGTAAIRVSLSIELALGVTILALVAWLGTLAPDG